MATVFSITGVNSKGDTLTVANNVELGKEEARKVQYRLGRDFNGGAITGVYVYSEDRGVYANVKVNALNWEIAFPGRETITRSLGDAHISQHSDDDLTLKPESRDWGPSVEALASEIFKALEVTVTSEVERLRTESQAKDDLIARIMATLTPEQLEEIKKSL